MLVIRSWAAPVGVIVATVLTILAAAPPAHAAAESNIGGLQTPLRPRPIVGGTRTEPGEFDAVVAILAGEGLCTGTVVSRRAVLTAGHCLANVEDASDIEVFFGDDLNSAQTIGVDDFGVHPLFAPDGDDEIFDYGFIVLSADFNPTNGLLLPIIDQAEWDQTMGVGGNVVVVGYGEDPDADDANRGIGTKRRVNTWISEISPQGFEFFAGGDQRDSCQGDSGGPAFVQLTNGEWRLAGIVSRGSNPCGDGGFYGVPYPALPWLRQEADVDLCGNSCGTCDCLDTRPSTDDGRCAVHRPQDAGLSPWLFGLLPLFRRRRRS